MAYVDLNPVRAAMAGCPEDSDFTSIQQRIDDYIQKKRNESVPTLKPFSARQADSDWAISFDYADYLELVDWTGRCCRDDKRGYISSDSLLILDRLGIDKEYWLKAMRPKGLKLSRAIGCLGKLKQYAERVGCAWIHGEAQSKSLYQAT